MKVFAYGYREYDEAPFFDQYAKEFGFDLGWSPEKPNLSNCDLAAGSDFLSVITTPIDRPMLDRFKELGIRMISTRTIGYDHIDWKYAKEIGIAVGNVTYSPECVADYTVMSMLMAIRKMKRILQRNVVNDFTLKGLLGGELWNYTVGVIGTGHIGTAVLRDLSGFGCKLYCTSRHENPQARQYAEYLPLEQLLEKCDIISLHLELNDATHHIIDEAAIARMKPGTIVINTARGGLIDSEALIRGLESGHLGGAALDVVEDEFGMYYYDRRADQLCNRNLSILRDMPNVLVTHHMAFYSDQAVHDMVYHSLQSFRQFADGADSPFRVV